MSLFKFNSPTVARSSLRNVMEQVEASRSSRDNMKERLGE